VPASSSTSPFTWSAGKPDGQREGAGVTCEGRGALEAVDLKTFLEMNSPDGWWDYWWYRLGSNRGPLRMSLGAIVMEYEV
jgi:hypothetical protein